MQVRTGSLGTKSVQIRMLTVDLKKKKKSTQCPLSGHCTVSDMAPLETVSPDRASIRRTTWNRIKHQCWTTVVHHAFLKAQCAEKNRELAPINHTHTYSLVLAGSNFDLSTHPRAFIFKNQAGSQLKLQCMLRHQFFGFLGFFGVFFFSFWGLLYFREKREHEERERNSSRLYTEFKPDGRALDLTTPRTGLSWNQEQMPTWLCHQGAPTLNFSF